MYGIPNMKLEKALLTEEINIMKEEGIVCHRCECRKGYKAGRTVKRSMTGSSLLWCLKPKRHKGSREEMQRVFILQLITLNQKPKSLLI